jgi:lipopolysaccharide/colanic/teichoic acid biosynthesis glycosyltransferase
VVNAATGASGEIGKRTLDVAVSTLLIAVLLVPALLIAVVVKLESRGTVFYRAVRIGRHGQPFAMLKFRKMVGGATGSALTLAGDPRFTRIGGFLAKTKLDELPQLWNILRGQMSLVGPRPEAPTFVARQRETYGRILHVRPGLTGLSQLAFSKESSILDPNDTVGHYERTILPQKLALDLMYVERRSLGSDLRIMGWTFVAVVLRRNVAVHRGTAKLNVRRRPVIDAAVAGGRAFV